MITAGELAQWTGGSTDTPDIAFEGVTFDSRTVTQGCLYIALDGTTVDGHTFVEKAFSSGAAVALVREDWTPSSECGCLVRVKNPRKALTDAAKAYRKILTAKIIGVTGSAGKTTTKELLAAFLSAGGKTSKTAGNFNNDLGLPITMLNTARDAKFAVWEMGSNHPGEIEYLVNLAKPTAGVISSVGTAHIEFFKNQDGIAREKGSLFAALPQNGFAVVSKENDKFSILKEMSSARTVVTSLKDEGAQYFARVIDESTGVFEAVEKGCAPVRIEINLPGEHNISNALLAFACAREFGVTASQCESALKDFTLPGHRWNVIERENNITFINDAYNANPTSMTLSLKTFSKMKSQGRKIAVLGDMYELGEMCNILHSKVGIDAKDLPIDFLFSVGEFSKLISDQFPEEKRKHFTTVESVREFLKDFLKPNDCVFLKASRGMHLEDILK
jgi:UDP-N-acetylmuramoyl-tripeptide--D-alanyl-D-alanine ligase